MASTTTTAMETTIQCPQCGSVQRGRADAPTVCRGCGAHLKPPSPSNVLSYARPADPVGVVCWRHGAGKDARIVIPDGGSTPDRCVRCNAPARGYRKRVKAYEPMKSDSGGAGFGPDAGAAAIAEGIIASVDLAIGLATRRSGVVHLAVCPACRRKATIAWRGALPLAFVALGAILAGSMSFASSHPHALAWGLTGTIGGAAVLIAAIWWAVAASHLLQIERVVGRELWFKPNGRAFLESLPERPEDRQPPT